MVVFILLAWSNMASFSLRNSSTTLTPLSCALRCALRMQDSKAAVSSSRDS